MTLLALAVTTWAAPVSRQARQILPFHPIHQVAGGDDRMGRAGAVVGVALLHVVGRDEGDAKIAVHIGADDGLVVARNRPRERLLGIGGRGRRVTPGQPALLGIHDVSRLDVAHPRRVGRGLRTGMMGIGAEHDRLALSRPRALEIGNGVLRARTLLWRREAPTRRQDISSLPPVLMWTADRGDWLTARARAMTRPAAAAHPPVRRHSAPFRTIQI